MKKQKIINNRQANKYKNKSLKKQKKKEKTSNTNKGIKT